MLDVLNKLEVAQYICDDEALAANTVEAARTFDHTIGCEFEIMPEAAEYMSKLKEPEDVEDVPADFTRRAANQCESDLWELGFSTDSDGLYEIISPAAQHSISLNVATRGIVRAGLLPDSARREVTTHISIGTRDRSVESASTTARLINLLRAMEIAGGSTADRLVEDPHNSYTGSTGWNYKGHAGVEVDARPHLDSCEWEGEDCARVEFRSLAYTSIDQFGQTLEMVYFLSRGLLDKNAEAADAYERFEKWFADYKADFGLEDLSNHMVRRIRSKKALGKYIQPYAQHIATEDLTEAKDKTQKTVAELKEIFELPDVESLLDPFVMAEAA